jgi:hypothetical protein
LEIKKITKTKRRELLAWHILDAMLKHAEEKNLSSHANSYDKYFSAKRRESTIEVVFPTVQPNLYAEFKILFTFGTKGKLLNIYVDIHDRASLSFCSNFGYFCIYFHQKPTKYTYEDPDFIKFCKKLYEVVPEFQTPFLAFYDLFEKNE